MYSRQKPEAQRDVLMVILKFQFLQYTSEPLEPEIAICGNGVVEDGEECDCGWEEDCLEDCCWPQRTKYSSNQLPCTLRPTKQCSPSEGPCCNQDCSYNIGMQCRDDNGCRDQSYCNGQGTHFQYLSLNQIKHMA